MTTISGGASCAAGIDYITASGTLNFASGDTSKPFSVTICNDGVFEGAENFNLTLSSPTGGAVIGTPNPANVIILNNSAAKSDYDGDGKADLSSLRTVSGGTSIWSIRESSGGVIRGYQWGLETDVPTPADFDGDGKTDVAIWRPGAPTVASFYILNSATQTLSIVPFGQTGDNPIVVADYDGDNKADPAVYRSGAQSVFYYRGSLSNPGGNVTFVSWGTTGDRPSVGDFNGNGKADFAIFRAGIWWILRDNGTSVTQSFGLSMDKLVPADYDGDGKTDFAVFRQSDSNWYILPSSTGTPYQLGWGLSTDILVPADYDGDGRTDIAVYRNGVWFILPSLNGGFVTDYFGLSTDYPLANTTVTP